MKRKVGLFLFAVMVAVSLGATIVASLAMYRLVSEKQAAEIRNLEASLSERFAVFQAMLRSQHAEITAHMGKVLPQIVAELESLGRKPGDLSVAELDALTKKYGVQYIYFIDRAPKVFQTNRRRQGLERRHRPVLAHGRSPDLQLLRPQGNGLHRRSIDRRPCQHGRRPL